MCVSRVSRGKRFHRLRLTQCNIILFTLLFRISTSLLVGNIGFTMNSNIRVSAVWCQQYDTKDRTVIRWHFIDVQVEKCRQ